MACIDVSLFTATNPTQNVYATHAALVLCPRHGHYPCFGLKMQRRRHPEDYGSPGQIASATRRTSVSFARMSSRPNALPSA